ncbi:putative integral membrane protein (TIGR00698 family) [Natranaerovirga hydrolytica]|uniref:Putative integral membrane protein (TIGR00698 family) n=1 Tax=Natranaerovirga hydrolytica TaxID=680378 RepID=A0A4R1MIF9_9FIRM|nr:putative sulfate exporter family transporter [Natranaerovirga hydrolytica]TCK92488.1 putative integral membrane protein (TIGR00698 family) [Natranaerovirga hydrolytica]
MSTINNKEEQSKNPFSSLIRKEDWWAVWLGIILIIGALIGGISSPVLPERWGREGSFDLLTSISQENILGIIMTGIVAWVVFSLSVYFFKKDQFKKFVLSFPIMYLLSMVAYTIGNYNPLRHYGFNNVIWALVIGLIISNVFGTPQFLKNVMRTELYIKTGLVLLGASILFNRVLSLGALGLGVAWFVTPVVIIVMYWFSQKVLKMKKERNMAITLVSALSVCGVSAAIATGSAAKAKKQEISLAISISLIFTILMMIIMPFLIRLMGLSPAVGGAWIGGTVDATGAVVAASTMLGDEAMEVASVIKMIQNVLIGIVAFIIATIWASVYEKQEGEKRKVSIKEIWIRMPKFILGFIGASLIFSFLIPEATVSDKLPIINGYRQLFFTLAFVSIGLESNFKDMAKLVKGGKPLKLYLVGQSLNVVLTLIAAMIFFSGRFFPLPF